MAALSIKQYGHSCWVNAQPLLADVLRAERGLEDAKTVIQNDNYAVVILSQVLSLLGENLISLQDIKELIDLRPSNLHLILIGNHMPAELTESLDNIPVLKDKNTTNEH